MRSNEIKKRIIELLEFSELLDKAEVTVNKLSSGMKRKLLLTRSIMHYPSILLLDEPTIGLDVLHRQKVWDLIKELNKRGITILLTTHYLEEAEALCNKFVLLNKGNLLLEGSKQKLLDEIGSIVVEVNDIKVKNEIFFFKNKKEAVIKARELKGDFNIRKTKLEDIFIKLNR
jgi:ABC-2 type transport system ATP-binding protein